MSVRRTTAALVLLVLFAALLLAVERHSPVGRADQAVWRWTKAHQVGGLLTAAQVVTDILSPPVEAAILLLTGLVLSKRRRSWQPVHAAAVTLVVLAVLVVGFKVGLGRPGPASLHQRIFNGSFPSGHAASLLVCGAALLLLTGWYRLRAAWFALAALMALIAACLIYAHFHFVSDVVGSVLLGTVIILVLEPLLTVCALIGAESVLVVPKSAPVRR